MGNALEISMVHRHPYLNLPTTTALPSTSSMATKPPIIPWSFLYDTNKPTIAQKTQPEPTQPKQKSFAEALNIIYDIPVSQLPKPSVKGNNKVISIPDDEYMKGDEA